MKSLVNTLIKHIENTSGGILIHCSAGVGRTGTLYIILSIMFKVKSGKYIKITIDTILKEIKEAREKRMTQVQMPEQFVYLCTYFGVKINQNRLQSNNKDTHNTSQFYDIPTINPNETFEIANKDCNKPKNRYKNILPYDNSRVVLKILIKSFVREHTCKYIFILNTNQLIINISKIFKNKVRR